MSLLRVDAGRLGDIGDGEEGRQGDKRAGPATRLKHGYTLIATSSFLLMTVALATSTYTLTQTVHLGPCLHSILLFAVE